MKKANIIRSIFWGLLALISLILGILGLLEYNKIFNNKKQDLESIIKIFNSSKMVEEYQNVDSTIKAYLDGKNIVANSVTAGKMKENKVRILTFHLGIWRTWN